ncbi:hypothetical protein [Alphaspiravirus yamagawaense]|uniref:Uncharacterized protein n=1 Tax=Alphaspiravirus yamagawaense TaxID=1157339 RepID=J7Q217_9VIRU|nr:hypothetical protein [Aeropyrum coil-shaped virus]CCG27870.1 hypothetical protein [Aeropyrum coil-shaped virus]
MERKEFRDMIRRTLIELGLGEDDADKMTDILLKHPIGKVVRVLRFLQIQYLMSNKKKKFSVSDIEKIIRRYRF